MRLYTFELNRQTKVGVEWQGQLVDIHAACSASHQEKPRFFPTDLRQFARIGAPALAAAQEALDFVKKRRAAPVDEQLLYPLDAVRLLAPIPRPGKILCSGNNYRGHQQENSAAAPTEPFFFAKMPTTVIGPGEPIVKPRLIAQLDYGVELAVIIGRRMKNTPESEVMSSIFGYTILNDITARDVQFKDIQSTLAKNFDTFCPLGPCIVTADEISDPTNLQLRAYLNGNLKQSGATADWIFPLPRLLSYLSQFMTLEPGDIISTGTPPGVGLFQKPPLFMKPGDTIALEIDGIGRLENPVIAEP
jgi:2-keto-4-pentenoate hydratase/2-oxohepta-3-ene-1,7-dioic acid hydratase in catechol pathway